MNKFLELQKLAETLQGEDKSTGFLVLPHKLKLPYYIPSSITSTYNKYETVVIVKLKADEKTTKQLAKVSYATFYKHILGSQKRMEIDNKLESHSPITVRLLTFSDPFLLDDNDIYMHYKYQEIETITKQKSNRLFSYLLLLFIVNGLFFGTYPLVHDPVSFGAFIFFVIVTNGVLFYCYFE